jgi:hypothetical protein
VFNRRIQVSQIERRAIRTHWSELRNPCSRGMRRTKYCVQQADPGRSDRTPRNSSTLVRDPFAAEVTARLGLKAHWVPTSSPPVGMRLRLLVSTFVCLRYHASSEPCQGMREPRQGMRTQECGSATRILILRNSLQPVTMGFRVRRDVFLGPWSRINQGLQTLIHFRPRARE